METSDRVEIWMCVVGGGGCWCTRSVNGPDGVGLWKNISQGWPFSHAIFCMILVMGLKRSFGKTDGVEKHLLLLDIQTYSDFAGIRMLVWLSL